MVPKALSPLTDASGQNQAVVLIWKMDLIGSAELDRDAEGGARVPTSLQPVPTL